MLKALLITVQLVAMGCIVASAQPAFKGGPAALDKFLSAMTIYPEYSKQNCISGTIKVGFQLDRNGNVINERVEHGLGIDLDEEALRVVKLTSGKWILPKNDQHDYIILPVRFQADKTPCGMQSAAALALAINNYKVQQGLQDAVTNYYVNKYLGKADTTIERNIIKLKKQLGYNDEFIDDVLDDAQQKLKQGDKDAACKDWLFIRNIGSSKADEFIAKYCK